MLQGAGTIFLDSAAYISGHTNIKATVPLAGKNVNARLHTLCEKPRAGSRDFSRIIMVSTQN